MALRAEARPAARRSGAFSVETAPKAQPSRPQLRVVAGKGRRWSPVPIIVLVVLAAFGVTALQASMGEDGLRRATLERQVKEETERLTLLRARVAQLSSPQRIADEAAELGMVPMEAPVHLEAPMASPTPPPEALDPEAVKRLTSPTP